MAGDLYKPFRSLYAVPSLAGMLPPPPLRAAAWRTPVLDRYDVPPGYDGLRGAETPTPVPSVAPAASVAAASAAASPVEPATPWGLLFGVAVAGYLLGCIRR